MDTNYEFVGRYTRFMISPQIRNSYAVGSAIVNTLP
jgi:hypothetical protein